jgi:hypothetical protein
VYGLRRVLHRAIVAKATATSAFMGTTIMKSGNSKSRRLYHLQFGSNSVATEAPPVRRLEAVHCSVALTSDCEAATQRWEGHSPVYSCS